MKLLFWTSLIFLAYIYLFYPLAIVLIAKFKNKPVRKGDITPSVSLIIAAYNEEKHMVNKIENTLSLDYPTEKLEIIVVSDGSTDGTNKIVKEYAHCNVKLVALRQRVGKTEAQNNAIEKASGEILFLTDATTILPPDALKKIVRNFCDSEVGCVGGHVAFRGLTENMTGAGLQIRLGYETYFRTKLSEIRSMFCVPGCICAFRKELFQPLRSDLVSDLVTPLQILEKGFRIIHESEALALVNRPTSAEGELKRRSRIVLQSIRGSLWMKHLANPFKYGFFVTSIYIHRLLRFFSPIFLLAVFFGNLFLVSHWFYKFTFFSQLAIYVTAAVGFAFERKGYKIGLVSGIFYFCLINAACLMGLFKLILGETGRTWEQVAR